MFKTITEQIDNQMTIRKNAYRGGGGIKRKKINALVNKKL